VVTQITVEEIGVPAIAEEEVVMAGETSVATPGEADTGMTVSIPQDSLQ
jgi:hypothetical protein